MIGAMAAIALPVDPVASGPTRRSTSGPTPGGAHGAPPDPGPHRTVADSWTPGHDAFAPSGRLLRLSAQLYNSLPDYELLAEGLAELLPAR